MITKNSHPRLGKQKCGASQKSNFATGSKHQTNFTTAHPRTPGFTLIELLVVISIIGLLSSIVLGNLNEARNKGRIASGKKFSSSLHHAIGDKLVGEWTFDQDNADDSSGFGNDGSLEGGLDVTNFHDGVMGKAVKFDGIDDKIEMLNYDSLDFGTTENVAVSAWFKMTQKKGADWQYIFGFPGWNSGLLEWGDGRLLAELRESDGTFHGLTVLSSSEYRENKWYHVVWQWGDGSFEVYIDGEKKADQSIATHMDWGNHFFLSALPHTRVGGTFNGFIDDVRIYNKTLTSAQIQQHYAEGVIDHQNLAQK